MTGGTRQAHIDPPATMPTVTQPKMRKPAPWIRQAVDLLLSDPTIEIKAIAEKVQKSRERVSRALGEPHVTAYIERRSRRKMAIMQARGAARMEHLITNAKSEQVQYRAAEFALEANGIAPVNQPQVSVNVELRAGYVISIEEREPAEKIVDGQGGEHRNAKVTSRLIA